MIIEVGETYRVTELDNCQMVPVVVTQTGKANVVVHRHDESPKEAFMVNRKFVRPLDFVFKPGMTVEFDGRRYTYETGYPDGSCMIANRDGITRPAEDAQLSVWVDDMPGPSKQQRHEDALDFTVVNDSPGDPVESEEAPEIEPMTRTVCVYMDEEERARYFFKESERDQMLKLIDDTLCFENVTVTICENVPF